jgi:sec-independent protein translocase protein TatC
MKLALVEKKKPGEPEEEIKEEKSKMSFLEHLDELRRRLVRIVIYIGSGFIISFYFHRQVFHFITAPILPFLQNKQLVFTGVTDAITFDMKVSFIAGVFLTSPLVLFEIWKFIAPGLYRNEKRYAIPFMVSSVLLFVGGGAFCYYMILPQVFPFLLKWNPDVGAFITIDKHLDFTNMMLLSFAVISEMPVVAAFLALFGLLTARFMLKYFKYAILAIIIVAAVVSPTVDAFGLFMWAVPMIALYIISIGVVALCSRRRQKPLPLMQ